MLTKLKQLGQDLRHRICIGVLQLEDLNPLGSRRAGIEITDHSLDQRHRFSRRAHNDGVGPDVRRQRDRITDGTRDFDVHSRRIISRRDSIHLLQISHHGAKLAGATAAAATVEHALDQRDCFEHVRRSEREVFHFNDGARPFRVEP